MEQNEESIVQDITTKKLPKNLNGPEGNVASKTVESVRLVEWGLSRLIDITNLYGYDRSNLQSCLTLDVEHFHATTHYKMPVMSMLQHCRSFGDCIKESLKRLSHWSVHYFTHPKTWYPVPEGSIRFKDIPRLKPLPVKKMSNENIQRLIDFSNVYGRAVRQRTGRQETTMAKARTLPSSCYNNANLPVEVVNLGTATAKQIPDNGDQGMETEEEIPVRVDSSNDIEKDGSSDEYDSDETDDEEVTLNINENQNTYDDRAQVAEEAFFLVGSRSRFGRTIRFNGKFFD